MLKLSRSAVELSLNCQRCFILQYKFRVSLRSLPFTQKADHNLFASAIKELMKKK